ncbi:MAG: cytochrome c biogenesis protein CcsA [Casimicrobiaceae bacterium]
MILLYLAVAAAYLAADWFEWRSITLSAAGGSASVATIGRWLPPFAIATHVVLIAGAIFTANGLNLSLANVLSAVAALIALLSWLGTLTRSMPGVAAVAFPVAAVGAILPALFPSLHRFSFIAQPWAALHIAVALLAYTLLIVAALQALVLMALEKRLHRGLPEPGPGALPPLLTLERFLFRLVTAGYVLLTLTLISGALFSEQIFGKPITFNHKTVFSLLSWLVFGGLLYGRHRYGWRGRTALNLILAGSALLLLAYFGSKFVLEVILGR